MPSFHAMTTWVRRIGAAGAFDNVSEVLLAREASHAQVDTLAARVARVTPVAVLRIEVQQRRPEHSGDDQAAEPFLIRGDDIPGCGRRARVANHLFVGGVVLVPMGAFLDVERRELPVPCGLVDPGE